MTFLVPGVPGYIWEGWAEIRVAEVEIDDSVAVVNPLSLDAVHIREATRMCAAGRGAEAGRVGKGCTEAGTGPCGKRRHEKEEKVIGRCNFFNRPLSLLFRLSF